MAKSDEITTSSLNATTLKSFQSTVPILAYNREDIKQGIVHLGIDTFHSSHLAVFLHLLMQDHNLKDWSICDVDLMKADALTRDAMKVQDFMYTVVERGIKDTNACVVGSITAYTYAPDVVGHVCRWLVSSFDWRGDGRKTI